MLYNDLIDEIVKDYILSDPTLEKQKKRLEIVEFIFKGHKFAHVQNSVKSTGFCTFYNSNSNTVQLGNLITIGFAFQGGPEGCGGCLMSNEYYSINHYFRKTSDVDYKDALEYIAKETFTFFWHFIMYQTGLIYKRKGNITETHLKIFGLTKVVEYPNIHHRLFGPGNRDTQYLLKRTVNLDDYRRVLLAVNNAYDKYDLSIKNQDKVIQYSRTANDELYSYSMLNLGDTISKALNFNSLNS